MVAYSVGRVSSSDYHYNGQAVELKSSKANLNESRLERNGKLLSHLLKTISILFNHVQHEKKACLR